MQPPERPEDHLIRQLQAANGFLTDRVDVLQCTLCNLGEGVVVADLQGRFLFFNTAAEGILGIGRRDVPLREWTNVYGCYLSDGLTPYPPEQLPLARAIRGEEVLGAEIFIRNPQRPDGLWISATGKPLRDRRGKSCGGVVVFCDITAHKRSFETIGLLSNALEQTDDSVIIADRDGIIQYVNPAVQRTTGYTRDEMLGQTPRILRSGRQDAEYYRKLWGVIVDGGVFRDTLVNRKKNGELYWVEQTITPMKDASGRITHYVSVAKDVTEQRKRQEQEIRLRLARDVQQRFYPVKPLSLSGIDIAGQAYPADSTGGDYFDFVPMPQDSLGIAIGDVSGHGFDSSLVMAETRAYLRAFARTETNVGEILNRANQALISDLEEGRFVTLSLARLEPSKRSLVYANAGHVPGYLLDFAGNRRQVLGSTGPPLGIFPQMDFPSSRIIMLDPGDVLVFLTDGITDAQTAGGDPFTAEQALAVVMANLSRSAREIVDELHRVVRAHMEGEPQLDDITCVVCKVAPD